jgi:acyl-homoserine-lactone acylase
MMEKDHSNGKSRKVKEKKSFLHSLLLAYHSITCGDATLTLIRTDVPAERLYSSLTQLPIKKIRVLPFLLSLIFVLVFGSYQGALSSQKTEILWDNWGVPHIYGKDVEGAFQAFGWAQMQSHGDLILRLYGQARGRAAEYWGEEYLDSDRWVRTMGIPARSEQWYEQQTPQFRKYLDAFAAGINAYAAEHRDQLDDGVEVVLPVRGEDVIAHVQRVLHFTFVVSPERIAGLEESLENQNSQIKRHKQDNSIPNNSQSLQCGNFKIATNFNEGCESTYYHSTPNKQLLGSGVWGTHPSLNGGFGGRPPKSYLPPRVTSDGRVFNINDSSILNEDGRVFNINNSITTNLSNKPAPTKLPGSNAWAIAPTHSESGNAMLLANPHLPWSDLYLWYEAQITAPGINAYGATLVGIPVLAIAFNDNLGWTHTVNTQEGWDAYELTLEKGGYRFDGQVKAFETEEQRLKIKQEDGSLREETLQVKRSLQGPIVFQQDNQAIALRVVGLKASGVLQQWWDMAKASNLAEFEEVVSRLQLPMFTIMYADRDGHIMHLFNAEVPVRDGGDFAGWQGLIPGDTSATLWTKTHPYQDLPRVIDPVSGWLQNANDPPWTTTFPPALDPDDYPAYMAPNFMDFRAQHSAKLLMSDEQISLAEMIEKKHSTRMELADRLLDELLPAAQQGSETARRAATVLEKWDRQANADSKGAVLFAAWVQELDLSNAFATPWSAASPLTTPDGLNDVAGAVAALERSAGQVEATYGALDVPWGQVFCLRVGNVDVPANGGDDTLGIFRTVWFLPQEDGSFSAFGGDSFVAAIEFSNPIKAQALMSYGNASQPGSEHLGDQLTLFAQKKLRPVWRSRQDILEHLSEQKVF